MPSNYTKNYHLNQWVKSDQVLMDDFNADNLAIDAAIKAVDAKADALSSGKVGNSEFNNLSQTVNDHTVQLAKRGNCKIETRSYTGNGQNNTTVSLTFSARPMLFLIFGTTSLFLASGSTETGTYIGSVDNGNSMGGSFRSHTTSVTWSGSQAKITIDSFIPALNTKAETYRAFAFIPMDA